MLVSESRPRTLGASHAGPLLYGDWGTSRLYVLGLAFFFTAHASVIYLAAIGVLMLAVSWAYTHVCRSFPDGGGVYTAARQLSPTLSVIGATLLLSGYIMTAAISVVEAFHYFGIPESMVWWLSLITIGLIGVINYFGARAAGRFALFVAVGALGVSAIMSILCIPFFIDGIRTISFDYFRQHSWTTAWVSFTSICLALAGVEAVANMTGLMKKPVGSTSKKTIWPVTIEVVALNMVFGLALAGLDYTVNDETLAESKSVHADLVLEGDEGWVNPAAYQLGDPLPAGLTIDDMAAAGTEDEIKTYRDTAMKAIAERSGLKIATAVLGTDPDTGEPVEAAQTIGFVTGKTAGITFGLLLLSATNTAIMAMVSVLFAMAQDRELPRGLTKLNYSGVPWVGLIVSLIIPATVIMIERDIEVLAKLYVLGVCGAITVTVGSCVLNPKLELSRPARIGMGVLAAFLLAVTLTIGITQLVSTYFSGGLILAALGSRAVMSLSRRGKPEPMPEPALGWLAELKESKLDIDPNKPKIMLAARGRNQAEFAVDNAKKRGATLFTIFVKPVRVMDLRPGHGPSIEEDRAAQESLGSVVLLAKANGVPVVPIYVVGADIAAEILDYTVTYGCDTLILGKSKRPLFARKLEGDVVTRVADNLPDDTALITRSADTPHPHKLSMPDENA